VRRVYGSIRSNSQRPRRSREFHRIAIQLADNAPMRHKNAPSPIHRHRYNPPIATVRSNLPSAPFNFANAVPLPTHTFPPASMATETADSPVR